MLNKDELNKLIDDLYDKANSYESRSADSGLADTTRSFTSGVAYGIDMAVRELLEAWNTK